ncbi:MAG: hypothetical protein B1H08_01630 [Candidatus Omnitrophica bacterium 4484_171]|nr:MAG: hypothetical protein B1H08_01630 [Candidatus Omnitrophica bacterium 4484_171]
MRKIKIFVVEDSILMHKVIADIFSHDPVFEVIGGSYKGKDALDKIPRLKPDIVTLDVNLPDLYGLTVLKEIMSKFPTRVVMISAYTQKGAEVTMKALELGALDFIPKPSGEISLDLYNFKEEIISKMKIVADIDINDYLSNFRGVPVAEEALSVKKLVVIAASTGGPKAIIEIMQKIPSNIEASFLIVQHMPRGFTRTFAERISWYSSIKTKEAEDGDMILKGAGYVAPGGFHMVAEGITDDAGRRFRIRLDETPLVNYVRPSADVTMNSAADLFGNNIVAVILTGMGKDGLEGARSIKNKGGFVIAQDKASSVVYGMPRAVADAGLTDRVLSLYDIPKEIIRMVV